MGGLACVGLRVGRTVAAGDGEAGSQCLGPRALAAPGDMMIDRVSPPARMRPLSLSGRLRALRGREQSDSGCGSWPRLCPI